MKKFLFAFLLTTLVSCGTEKEFQVREIRAKLERIEKVERYGEEDHWRFHFREVNGWRLPFSKEYDLADTINYKVGMVFSFNLVK